MMRGNSVWEKLRRSIAWCNIQESEDRVSRKLQVSYFWRNQVFDIFLKSFLNDSKLDFYSFFSRKVPSSYSKWQIAEIFLPISAFDSTLFSDATLKGKFLKTEKKAEEFASSFNLLHMLPKHKYNTFLTLKNTHWSEYFKRLGYNQAESGPM